MPSRLTRHEDTNVAATPIKAHSPLKPPMIDGFKPVKQCHDILELELGFTNHAKV